MAVYQLLLGKLSLVRNLFGGKRVCAEAADSDFASMNTRTSPYGPESELTLSTRGDEVPMLADTTLRS